MGKAEKERLKQTLNFHLNTIHETFQVLDQSPASSLEKVSWEEVIKLGDQVSKQATMAGMLWTGEMPDVKALEENMSAYFNTLQGFLLHSHGSMVGAGHTLSSSIHTSVKQVVDCSFKLWMESVSSYAGSRNNVQKLSIPQLVGAVWEACSALKKTPSTNITAIGRGMTQVAVSLKDVLREMKELKPGSSDQTDETYDEASNKADSDLQDDDDNSCEDDLGNDLLPGEMKIAQLAIGVVSDTLAVIKELIRTITGLLKMENPNNTEFVDCLEKLLKLCQGIGAQIDELGACLYPPQEVPAMKASSEKISSIIDDLMVELESVKGTSQAFIQACDGLRNSLRLFEYEIGCCSTSDLEAKLQNVTLSN
ncbi:hypothetical protein I3760_05G241200 [Carya illinoinensis]|uniref:Uncharacterized protein n=1 Tax=Carya illinoinensis TaxID=32201 RepID=A0A8T1QP22_CARIL|nr:uncharacterized protein LOC122311927 isoform X1 [Carya illinoinensis]KAG2709473.1 hypothetical protein I3760_05G241200 [Carya illinoinensis]KAG6655854.1 hypothetical protein CIPAW_05G245400 [Carya illinoinensis]KAG6715167.1 hypothetical protein I3842_05G237600 [Carya illinoinensis]